MKIALVTQIYLYLPFCFQIKPTDGTTIGAYLGKSGRFQTYYWVKLREDNEMLFLTIYLCEFCQSRYVRWHTFLYWFYVLVLNGGYPRPCTYLAGSGTIFSHIYLLVSNQITVVAFQPVQLAQASFLQKKNQMLQNVFLISVTLRWHRVSVACKNQSF